MTDVAILRSLGTLAQVGVSESLSRSLCSARVKTGKQAKKKSSRGSRNKFFFLLLLQDSKCRQRGRDERDIWPCVSCVFVFACGEAETNKAEIREGREGNQVARKKIICFSSVVGGPFPLPDGFVCRGLFGEAGTKNTCKLGLKPREPGKLTNIWHSQKI